MAFHTIRWSNGSLSIIDQTLLPGVQEYLNLETAESVWEAIRNLRVRGAPAIGICAAFGVVVGLREKISNGFTDKRVAALEVIEFLRTARPTAVNLFWALERMQAKVEAFDDASITGAGAALLDSLEGEAERIFEEDVAMCRAIGVSGAPLLQDGMGVLTHCNAGALATGAHGTALSVLTEAHRQGRRFRVFADETRPLLQGARLTAWELMQSGIDTHVICDSAAAHVMAEGKIDLVLVGADRIAANGDAANKIGTYGLAVLAKAHGIPFYVAAPYSTFDLAVPHGSLIPIEQRDAREITEWLGVPLVPPGTQVYNPAFDVTPADFIMGFITNQGILRPPYPEAIRRLLKMADPKQVDKACLRTS